MQEVLDAALGWFSEILWAGFDGIMSFLLGFLPDADSGMLQAIDGIGNALTGQGLTFNVMFFIDVPLIAGFFSMMVVVVVACYITKAVLAVIDVVTKLMDAIPIIG